MLLLILLILFVLRPWNISFFLNKLDLILHFRCRPVHQIFNCQMFGDNFFCFLFLDNFFWFWNDARQFYRGCAWTYLGGLFAKFLHDLFILYLYILLFSCWITLNFFIWSLILNHDNWFCIGNKNLLLLGSDCLFKGHHSFILFD